MSLGARHYFVTPPIAGGPHVPITGEGGTRAAFMGRLSPVESLTGGTMVPYVTSTWSESVDSLGVSYPPGLVVVNATYESDVDFGATYPDSIDAAWLLTGILVPSTLPAGYTPRYERDIYAGSLNADISFSSVSKYRTQTGYSQAVWRPVLSGSSRGVAGSTGISAISGGKIYSLLDLDSVGWRSLKLSYGYTDATHTHWTGSLSFRVTHNADGSRVATGTAGDTVDATGSFSFSDFTNDFGDHYQSVVKDLGSVIPTLGKASTFVFDITIGAGGSGTFYDWQMSPNLTVPLWFSCTGEGGLIAPGGIVA